ncbi:hypothetical protein HZH68_007471 [Vespula germanica]|uniref:Uncharacterized protein n=1 Tax=Vespula germanica TaxID=30212 RepID=A0A834K9H8_VESGE|nr:hypothetical protein HZH68_007471 [Vespula germanica]
MLRVPARESVHPFSFERGRKVVVTAAATAVTVAVAAAVAAAAVAAAAEEAAAVAVVVFWFGPHRAAVTNTAAVAVAAAATAAAAVVAATIWQCRVDWRRTFGGLREPKTRGRRFQGKFRALMALWDRSDIKKGVAILNCLYARQLCFEDPSCSAILEIIPRVCGPELVCIITIESTNF